MKAARLNAWGKELELEDIPQPEPADDQVLVRVHAASVNPFDAAVQAGYLQFMASTPLTMGTDFAGEVVAAGPKVTHVKPGDEVYGLSVLGGGTFAEYLVAKPNEVVRKPRSLDMLQAAGVPLPAMAAWISLNDQAQLKSGERLLVHGASGNVGTIVVQLAKSAGAYVYGTDIPEKEKHIEALGLDRFIMANDGFEGIVRDNVDVVVDLVGGELMEKSYHVLRPGGRYVTTLLGETPQEEPERLGIRSMGVGAYPRADVLTQIADLIDSGKLKVFVNRVFPLEQVNEAMAYRLQTTAPGKVVVSIA
ncbi:MAG: NADP-dependent oxidoreductase [Bacteroidota bacterium]